MEIIETLPLDPWSFDGGTALLLQLGHRESYDIDLFTDPRYLPYLLESRDTGLRARYSPSSYLKASNVADAAQLVAKLSRGHRQVRKTHAT